MKTLDEIFDYAAKTYAYENFESAIDLGSTRNIDEISKHAAIIYAREVAEAVRSECYFKINTGSVRIKDIDIEQFIK